MQIAILGPLEVRDGAGRPVDVAGSRLRALLARLSLDANRPVSTSTLAEAVWGADLPAEEANALQTLVSRLRRALGDPAAVVQSPGGYRLAVSPDAVDAARFTRLAAAGAGALQAGNAEAAERELDAALGLWRGPADAIGDDQAARLDEVRLAARVDRADARLRTGRGTSVIGELSALTTEQPLDERIAALLLRALAAAGRQADALLAYDRMRERLADELGVDPGPQLQDLHLQLLRGELAPPAGPTRRTNLKTRLTSFVGRDDEVARIGKSLEQNRLVTLVGPGGAGKTRLATEAAERVVDSAPDGVWLVELAPVTADAEVAQAVLGSLGVSEIHLMERRAGLSARDAQTRLVESLAGRRLVLVLDNCEHLVEAVARLADSLLGECPGLRVLATSREPLGIVGEVLLTVPPLDRPGATATAAEALEFPAVRLFADRAAAVQADFVVHERTVATVVEIVTRLDGLPLAIELAAARLRTMPLADVASRLSDRFRLLTGGSRTALPRHRTLRAVVEWSWELLAPDERSLVEQLAIFPGGVTVDSAAAVSDLDPLDVTDLLASLVDKSLLQPVGDGHRMRMLETIREYGIERLGERGVLADIRHRHADHFGRLVVEAEPHLVTADQLRWFEALTAERDNILAALRYRCDLGDADGALHIAVALATYAMLLGMHADLAGWAAEALAVPGWTDAQLRVAAEAVQALNAAAVGDADLGHTSESSLAGLARRLADVDPSISHGMAMMKVAIAFFGDERDLAERFVQESVDGPDEWSRAAVRMFRSSLAENNGDVATMRAETAAAWEIFDRLGERWGMASTLRELAHLHTVDGDLDAAADCYRRSLTLVGQLQSHDDEGFLLCRLADVEMRRGDVVAARSYLDRARAAADEAGTTMESVYGVVVLAQLESECGNLDEAHRHYAEAMARIDMLPREHPVQGHIRAILLGIATRLSSVDGDRQMWQFGRDAFEAALGTKDQPVVAAIGVTLADVVALTGEPERAAGMLGAAAALRGSDDRTALDVRRVSARLHDELGATRFDDLYAEGKSLDRDAAIERLRPS